MTNNKSIFLWLLACIILVYAMIIVGGYTRLTHSGLSIVEWKPISGSIPPLNESAWNLEFSKYQHSPEYQKINHNMDLGEFKQIFLIEYFHRLLGRITGIVFFLPFLYFAYFKKFNSNDIKHFLIITGLIAAQGGIGWLMVKSGLIDQPSVSQYRLALHLLMACIILILLLLRLLNITVISASSLTKELIPFPASSLTEELKTTTLLSSPESPKTITLLSSLTKAPKALEIGDIRNTHKIPSHAALQLARDDELNVNLARPISKYGFFTLGLFLLQITSGAFVAGLHAGLIYNTFPLMNGELIPEGLMFIKPWYLNIFENVTTVQFIHRILGIINVINILIYSHKIRNKISIILMILIILQFTLGVMTLLLQVPLILGLLHQALAIIILITLVISLKNHTLKI